MFTKTFPSKILLSFIKAVEPRNTSLSSQKKAIVFKNTFEAGNNCSLIKFMNFLLIVGFLIISLWFLAYLLLTSPISGSATFKNLTRRPHSNHSPAGKMFRKTGGGSTAGHAWHGTSPTAVVLPTKAACSLRLNSARDAARTLATRPAHRRRSPPATARS